MNPIKPSHATARLRNGLSRAALSFGPILLRKEMTEKRMTKMEENASETAMKTGVVAVGADSSCDEMPCDRTDKSAEERNDH